METTPLQQINFQNITSTDIVEVLGLTIKKDDLNKLVTFLCELSAYTGSSQFNISYNAPSSSGKSFIPLQISNLFPSEDVIKLGNCSPNAFFHEQGYFDKERNAIIVDLSRKILIFKDQPDYLLLSRLRSLLSHDEKEMQSKITDKSSRGGNRTKTVILIGYPAVIFCSASLKFDEQEATRFILLSPETNQEKIREAIVQKLNTESDNLSFYDKIEHNPERLELINRIRAIKEAHIDEIKISNIQQIEKRFFNNYDYLKPRHQRDIGRLLSLIKIFALLNLWHRNYQDNSITANDKDIEEAFKIWDQIYESQELNLPPYIYSLYREIILPAYKLKRATSKSFKGLSRQDIQIAHFSALKRSIPDWQLRQDVLPMLESAGLIIQEQDPNDKRKILVIPASVRGKQAEKNSELGGVQPPTELGAYE